MKYRVIGIILSILFIWFVFPVGLFRYHYEQEKLTNSLNEKFNNSVVVGRHVYYMGIDCVISDFHRDSCVNLNANIFLTSINSAEVISQFVVPVSEVYIDKECKIHLLDGASDKLITFSGKNINPHY